MRKKLNPAIFINLMIRESITIIMAVAALLFGYYHESFNMELKYGIDKIELRNFSITYDEYYGVLLQMQSRRGIQRTCVGDFCSMVIGDGEFNETMTFGAVFAYRSGFGFYIEPGKLEMPKRHIVVMHGGVFANYMLTVYKRGY